MVWDEEKRGRRSVCDKQLGAGQRACEQVCV